MGQCRAGGKQRAQRGQVVARPGLQSNLVDGGDVPGTHAEHGDAFPFRNVPQRARTGVKGGAVVKHHGAPARQCADQPVPHHPAAGREEEEPVVAGKAHVQPVFLQVLEQRAADAVHDALRLAGGARRIEDVERMVEVDLRERGRGFLRQFFECRGVVRRADDRNPDDLFQRRNLPDDLLHLLAHIDAPAAIEITIAGEQHPGFDLPEAVERPFRTEIRRTGRPGRAECGGGQHGDDGLDGIGQPARHHLARADAEPGEPCGERRAPPVKPGVGDFTAFAGFQVADQGDAFVAEPEEILRIIEPGPIEPDRAGKPLEILDRGIRRPARAHAGEFPYLAPECAGVFNGPGVKTAVGVEHTAGGGFGLAGEPRHVRGGDVRRRWPPQRLAHGCIHWRTERKQSRTSVTNSSGCSKAAKCPPFSSSFQ